MQKTYWYAPEEIMFSYTNHQIRWMLPHLVHLQAGCWPEIENELVIPGGDCQESVSSGKAGSLILYIPNPDAMRIGSELAYRLKRCGRDGEIVRSRYTNHKSVKEVCEKYNIERAWVFHVSQRCAKYMEGWPRRKGDYQEWCKRKGVLNVAT